MAYPKIQTTNKQGTHKKKCEICGLFFDESNSLDVLLVTGPAQCPFCNEIIDLESNLKDHWRQFMSIEANDPIEQRNYIKDAEEYKPLIGDVESYTLDKFEKTFEIIGRTKRVKAFIELLEKARKYLYETIHPQIQILESFYERKDRFWLDGGNLCYYIKNAVVESVVIKLKEYLNSNSSFSLPKIRNIVRNDKKYLFDSHKIYIIKKFQKSGDISKIKFPHFEIEKYLVKLDAVLDSYSNIINAIQDYRNNMFAHINVLNDPNNSEKELTFHNIKRIFNSLRIIYDGFYYSIAPDLYSTLIYDHNLYFDYLNGISMFYNNQHHK